MIDKCGMSGGRFNLRRKERRRVPSLQSGGSMTWTFWGMVVIAVVAIARGVYWDTKARSVGAERDEEMGR
jgi:hypothetical protein